MVEREKASRLCPVCPQHAEQRRYGLCTCPSCGARWWPDEAISSNHTFDKLIADEDQIFDWRNAGPRHYSVYVVLLKDTRGKRLKWETAYYVGMTGLSPEERLLNHKKGHKRSPWVQRFGVALLPWKYRHLNPLTREEAEGIEVTLAEELRREGLIVFPE